MKTSSRIMLNAVSKWGAIIVNAVIGVILIPFLFSQLGTEGYGMIALIGAIVGFSTVADLGISGALGRHLAEQVVRKDNKTFNELASTGLVMFLFLGSICAGIFIVFASLLVNAFNVSESLKPQMVFLIRWYGSLSIMLSFITPIFRGILNSNNRFDLKNYIDIGLHTCRGIALFLVLGLTGAGIYGWAGVTIVCRMIALLFQYHMAHRIWHGLSLSLNYFRRDALKSLFSLGGYMYGIRISNLLSIQADPIVITIFFGPYGVALYKPAARLPELAWTLSSVLSDQLYPLATGYHVKGEVQNLQAILIKGTRYTLLMGIPACIILGVFAMPIMRLWLGNALGPDYRISALMLMGLAVIHLLYFTAGTQWSVLLGMKRLKFMVWLFIPTAVLNILISIFLVGYTQIGVPGVIIATAVVTMIRRPIFFVYTAKVIDLSPWRYFMESYVRPIVLLLLLGSAALVELIIISPNSMLSLGACVASVLILWVALCWWVGFDRLDRKSFGNLFGRIRTNNIFA